MVSNVVLLIGIGLVLAGVVYVAVQLASLRRLVWTQDALRQRQIDDLRASLISQIAAAGTDLQRALTKASPLDVRREHEKAADMGIALAERMARLHPVGPRGEKALTSFDKAKMAVDWAVAYCNDISAPITPAEMRKIVEIRLEQTQPAKKR